MRDFRYWNAPLALHSPIAFAVRYTAYREHYA
jgi:hypothetical protein